jgi:hypothetical protein
LFGKLIYLIDWQHFLYDLHIILDIEKLYIVSSLVL